VTQLIARPVTYEPIDDVRDALVCAITMARGRIAEKATLVTRIEGGGSMAETGVLAHVVTELLLDAANAFPGPIADGNVIVITSQNLARFAVVRVSDNASGTPRHALCLAQVVARFGGELRVEASPGDGATVTILLPLEDDDDDDDDDAP
jgi:signal transduction histidine kinase